MAMEMCDDIMVSSMARHIPGQWRMRQSGPMDINFQGRGSWYSRQPGKQAGGFELPKRQTQMMKNRMLSIRTL